MLLVLKWTERNEISDELLLLKNYLKGGRSLEDNKKLTQIEIDNIIDETINLSIISKLLKINLITEKEFYILKEKIKCFS